MALEFRGRLILRGGGAENAEASLRRRRYHHRRHQAADSGILLLHRHSPAVRRRRQHPQRAVPHLGNPAPGEGTEQAVASGAGGLVHAPPPFGLSLRRAVAATEGCAGEEAGGAEHGVHREEMPPLRRGEDAAVADGADGAEDAVQCVWCEVQVREVGGGVSSGGEPDVCVGAALEFSPEGFGAEEAEGHAAAAAAATDESEFDFRRIQRWR